MGRLFYIGEVLSVSVGSIFGNISFWKKKMGYIPPGQTTSPKVHPCTGKGQALQAAAWTWMELFLMDMSPTACVNPEAMIA